MPLSLYPPIPYSHVSDHIVTVGVLNNMLFIRNPISATHWRIFIHRCRSCMCQDCRRCGPQFFPIFRMLQSWFRKYRDGGMRLSTLLGLPMRGSRLYVFIFVKARDALMWYTQAISFSSGINTRRERVLMSQTRKVLLLASWTSPTSFQSERGSYCFRGSLDWRGLNMVWMMNKSAFLARST